MLASSRSWELIAYWAVWFAVMLLPRFLYRGERRYEVWEIHAAHPQYARVLRLRPYVTGAFAVPLLAGLLYVLYLSPGDPRFLVHLVGLLYGGFLILDASLVWHSGIRPLSSFGPRRFVIEEQPSWRTKLMMRVAFGYCAVAVALLFATVW